MPDPTLNEQIAAARAYQALHVPALFQEWVEPVLEAANVGPGQRVLDVACGTGVLARSAQARAVDGMVAGVDPNEGMLAVAKELAPGVRWQRGTAEDLPFPDASFDAVVSQFGLMFFGKPSVAVGEMLRVLEPGGALVVAVWDALENSPAYARAVALLLRIAGQEAADALRAPFALGDPEELVALFDQAGADSPVVQTMTGTARFPSIRSMVEADLRGWLPVMGVELPEDQIESILLEAETELAEFLSPEGSMRFPSPAHVVSARKAV